MAREPECRVASAWKLVVITDKLSTPQALAHRVHGLTLGQIYSQLILSEGRRRIVENLFAGSPLRT